MDTRWNIKVSGELDRELRIYLAERGLKRGALSHLVEDAVREKLFRRTVEEVKERNAESSLEEIEADVAGAVSEARPAGSPRH